MLNDKSLAHEDAARGLDAMASEYAAKGLKAVLAVTDSHGELVRTAAPSRRRGEACAFTAPTDYP